MSEPIVSYILAVYNGRQYLAEALNSIHRQSRPVEEIIVVDDGSTDDTADIAGRSGPLVRCIRQHNAGQSAARNHGVRVSRGETMPAVLARHRLHQANLTRNHYESHIEGLQRFYKEKIARGRQKGGAG